MGLRGPAPPLSNRLADLAERAGEAWRRHKAASVEAAAAYLEAGALLVEARAECGHGDWLPFLARAGVPERTARRMMRLARAGMTPDAIAEAGGVKAALEALARPRKSDTVTDLQSPDPAERARRRRADRRAAGRCLACGEPAEGHARCPPCRAREAARTRSDRAARRALAPLAPRLAEAAEAGTGLALTAAEVTALARTDTAR